MNRNPLKPYNPNNYNSIQQQYINSKINGNQDRNNNIYMGNSNNSNNKNTYNIYSNNNNQQFNIKKQSKNNNRSLTIDHSSNGTYNNNNIQQPYLTINHKRNQNDFKTIEKNRSESMQDQRKKRPVSQQHHQQQNQLLILNPYQQAMQKQKQPKKLQPEKRSQTIDSDSNNYYSQNGRKQHIRKNTDLMHGNNQNNYLTIQPYNQYSDIQDKQSKTNKYNSNQSNQGNQIFTIKKNNNFNYMKDDDKEERIKNVYSKQNTYQSHSQNPRNFLLNQQQLRNARSSQDHYNNRNGNNSFENFLDQRDKKKNTQGNNKLGKLSNNNSKNTTVYSMYGAQQKQNPKNLNNINISLLKNGNQRFNTEGNDIPKIKSNQQNLQKQKQWNSIINTEGNDMQINKNTRQNNFLQEQKPKKQQQQQITSQQAQKNVQTINNLLKTIQTTHSTKNNNNGQKQNVKNQQLNVLTKSKQNHTRSKSQNSKKYHNNNNDSDVESKYSRSRTNSKYSKELSQSSKDDFDSVLSNKNKKKREKKNLSMIELNQSNTNEELDISKKAKSNQSIINSEKQLPETVKETIIEIEIDHRTKQGKLASNPNKVNQDTQMQSLNINNSKTTHFFAVCDGHGSLGHHVSGFVKQFLPLILLSDTNLVFENPKQALFNGFAIVNHQLLKTESIDCAFSGTTLVSVLMKENTLFCANAGDSRAVVGFINQKGEWQNKDISRDHKPSIDFEAERIIKCGGRIDTFRDKDGNQLGPLRVWLKNENIPGLAMSRSIGDNVATSVGVTWEPEIFEFTIQKQDNFLILASDGVWEFLDSIEVVQMVSKYYEKGDLKGACDAVLEESYARWTKDDDSVIDDITLQIIFFKRRVVEKPNKELITIEDY